MCQQPTHSQANKQRPPCVPFAAHAAHASGVKYRHSPPVTFTKLPLPPHPTPILCPPGPSPLLVHEQRPYPPPSSHVRRPCSSSHTASGDTTRRLASLHIRLTPRVRSSTRWHTATRSERRTLARIHRAEQRTVTHVLVLEQIISSGDTSVALAAASAVRFCAVALHSVHVSIAICPCVVCCRNNDAGAGRRWPRSHHLWSSG